MTTAPQLAAVAMAWESLCTEIRTLFIAHGLSVSIVSSFIGLITFRTLSMGDIMAILEAFATNYFGESRW
jgi:hypothetical protein